jgi:hypothetical protein
VARGIAENLKSVAECQNVKATILGCVYLVRLANAIHKYPSTLRISDGIGTGLGGIGGHLTDSHARVHRPQLKVIYDQHPYANRNAEYGNNETPFLIAGHLVPLGFLGLHVTHHHRRSRDVLRAVQHDLWRSPILVNHLLCVRYLCLRLRLYRLAERFARPQENK